MKPPVIIIIILLVLACKPEQDNRHGFSVKGELPVIEIFINDKDTACFLIDTGSDICVIDSSFYLGKGYSHTAIAAITVRGGSGYRAKSKNIYTGFDFSYNERNYDSNFFYVSDLKSIIPDIDGIIGGSFLQNKVLLIDYEKGKVEFSINDSILTPYTFTDSTNFSLYKKGPFSKTPHIKATLVFSEDTELVGEYILDTGNWNDIHIWQNAADSLSLVSLNKKKYKLIRQNGNISGEMEGFIIRADSFVSGNLVHNSPIVYFDQKQNKKSVSKNKTNSNGLIGNNILSNYIIAFDYPERKFYYKKIKEARTEDYFYSGITVGKNINDGLIIDGLIFDTPADSAGIRVGDILLKVDEIKALPSNRSKIIKLLKTPGVYRLKHKRKDSIFIKKVPVKKLL
jgi:hypothetical protein